MSRCAATTQAGRACTFTAAHGPLCTAHAAASGDQTAVAEQRARRASRPVVEELRQRHGRGKRRKPIPQLADLSRYQNDPCLFADEVLGIHLWAHQRRALVALVAHRRVTWRSCHGAGKSVVADVAALWWICVYPDSLVILTAPSGRQVRQVLWRGLRKLVAGARVSIGPSVGDVPELGWSIAPDRMILGLTSDTPERFVGLHAGHVLIVGEEASGIATEIFGAIKGSLTGDSRLLLISNPTQLSGEFYESHHGKRDLYHCLHTSAADVMREAGGLSGLIDQQFARELVSDYGEQSAVVAIKIHGEFPTTASDTVIPYALVEEARARWSPVAASGTAFGQAGDLEIGCDPARFGDDLSCIVARRGCVALEPITYQHLDGVALAARVLEVADRLRRGTEVPIVRVDSIGIGASVVDQLNRTANGSITIVPINVGEASESEQYERLRDQLWFGVRDWLKAGGCLPPDDRLAGELIAPTFGFSPRQRIKVEAKDETRKRLRRSPDRADALALAVGVPQRPRTACDAYDEIFGGHDETWWLG